MEQAPGSCHQSQDADAEIRPQFSLFWENLCGPAGYLNSFRSLVPTEVERNWKLVEMQKTDTGGAAGPLGPCQDANRPPAGGREYFSGPVRWPGSMVRTRPPWP